MIARPGAAILSGLGVAHMPRDLKTEESLVAKIAGVGHEACLQGLFGWPGVTAFRAAFFSLGGDRHGQSKLRPRSCRVLPPCRDAMIPTGKTTAVPAATGPRRLSLERVPLSRPRYGNSLSETERTLKEALIDWLLDRPVIVPLLTTAALLVVLYRWLTVIDKRELEIRLRSDRS
jgi:hypothetical protein